MASAANPAAQLVGKTFEALRLYADTNLNVLRQMTNFAANVAKEGVSLSAELHTSTLEALQVGQSYVLRRLSSLPEASHNPVGYFQQSMSDGVTCTEATQKLLQGNAQAVLHAIEHYWMSAQQTGNSMQTSYTQLADQLKTLYTAS
jgi:hypothetical protein